MRRALHPPLTGSRARTAALSAALLVPIGVAHAAPERVAYTWTVASPNDLVPSSSGETVAVLGDGLTLLNLATWETTAISVCADPRGITAGTYEDRDAYWIGCGDGTVARVDLTGDSPTLASDTLAAADTAITAVEWDGTYLYVLSQGSNGLADLTAITPKDAIVAAGYPTTLSYDEVDDTLLLNGSLYVVHGSDNVSRVTTTGAGVVISTQTTGADYGNATATSAGMVYLTDSSGGDIWSFDTGSNGFSLMLSDVGDATTALCIDESSTDGWAAIAADDDVAIYNYASGMFGEESDRLTGVGPLDRLLPANAGALGLSTDESLVKWLTDAPWVQITSAPTTATTGDIAFSFVSDVDGEWTLWRGGSLDNRLNNATALDSGPITAGETITATTTVSSSGWVEGKNRVWVTVDDAAQLNLTGHDATDVVIDTPPPAMDYAVGFGESTVNVQITASNIADIVHYEVYLSDVPFSAADYATGGPTFDSGDVTAPKTLNTTAGAAGSYTFYPLINGTTYYVAVRAVDAAGAEGPMSAVLSATPSYTYSASELRGDEGGFGCSSVAGTHARYPALLGLILSGAVVLRRRHRSAVT